MCISTVLEFDKLKVQFNNYKIISQVAVIYIQYVSVNRNNYN